MTNCRVRATGFSLFELVLVVVLLAVIMAFAIPQYIGIKNQAHNASVDVVAGGFASAVLMVKGQWELSGRPKGVNNTTHINYGGVIVGVDGHRGTPTGDKTTNTDTRASAMTALQCQKVLSVILQDAPTSTLSTEVSIITKVSYLVRHNTKNNQCIYYLTHNLNTNNLPTDGAVMAKKVGFSYFPTTGKVQIFKN